MLTTEVVQRKAGTGSGVSAAIKNCNQGSSMTVWQELSAQHLMSPPGGEKAKQVTVSGYSRSRSRMASSAAVPPPSEWPVHTCRYTA